MREVYYYEGVMGTVGLTRVLLGVGIEKLINPHHPMTTPSDTIDIDKEIMRRLQRIGSFTGTGFVKSGDVRRD
jgi:hypothetical protein